MQNLIVSALFLLAFLGDYLPLQAMMEGQDDSVTEVVPQTNYAKLKPSKLLKHAERGDNGARQYLIKTLTTLFVNDELLIVFGENIDKLPQLLNHIQNEAAASNPLAQFCLGFMYKDGWGVAQDYEKAAQLYQKSANQGLAPAQSNLASMYQRGKGVPQDSWQAAHWCRKAAEQGLAITQCNLGCMYEQGKGVPQDYEQAAYWYRKAAEQGFAEAQCNLGDLYLKGWLGFPPQAPRQAMEWYQKAAGQSYKRAQWTLKSLYLHGWFGLPQDEAKAQQWEKRVLPLEE